MVRLIGTSEVWGDSSATYPLSPTWRLLRLSPIKLSARGSDAILFKLIEAPISSMYVCRTWDAEKPEIQESREMLGILRNGKVSAGDSKSARAREMVFLGPAH